jgi:hypothetical protein
VIFVSERQETTATDGIVMFAVVGAVVSVWAALMGWIPWPWEVVGWFL